MGGSSLPGGGKGRDPAALPPELAALDAATRVALSAAEHADEWGASSRAGVLAWVAKLRDRIALLEGRVLRAEQAAGTWALRGDRDLAGFAGRLSRGGRGAGSAAVSRSATLTAMPVVADALVDGPVTGVHLAEITRATAVSPALAAELTTERGQAHLVELAGRFDGAAFGRQLKRMSAALDPASRQREHDEQRANRYLRISHTGGGTLVKAQLDSVAGHQFARAIDALNPRPAKDDERDEAQRRADALAEMVHRTLTDERTTPGTIAPVQAIVTIGEETWAALRGAHATSGRGRDGGGPEVPKGSTGEVLGRLRGVAPVVDEAGRVWPASEVARALCDCVLTRAVVDADGMTLSLGRDERFFQRRHWLALLASGITTCAYPGCSMPLRNTELHHLTWWDAQGGRSDLENCGPYCRFHHDRLHTHAIAVTRRPDGSYEHRDRRGLFLGIGGRVGSPGGSAPGGTAFRGTRPDGVLAGRTSLAGAAPPGASGMRTSRARPTGRGGAGGAPARGALPGSSARVRSSSGEAARRSGGSAPIGRSGP